MAIPRVLGKNILSKRIERGTIKNGLIIPINPNGQKEYQVCAIGPEVKDISIGDIVCLGYGIHEIFHNDIPYVIIEQDQVLAILPQE